MVYARVCQNSRLPAAAQSAAPRRQYSGAPVHEPSAHKDRLLGWLKEGQYRSRELTEIATYLNKHGLLQTGKEYCLLATALGKKYMWRGAVKLLSTLRGNAVQTDAYMCSNAVAACDTDGGAGWEHSVQIIMDMEINAMRRYEQVYNGAISACRKQQKWQGCCQITLDVHILFGPQGGSMCCIWLIQCGVRALRRMLLHAATL